MIKKLLLTVCVLACFSFRYEENKHSAEIAIVADLSGSTNGLLDDLRDNLWNLINCFNRAHPETELRLAFVGFSRGSFGLENAYVRALTDLTSQYDFISYELFRMVGNVEKGEQYVGAALKTAIRNLSWSEDQATKKLIMLFGNSRADLGHVDYNEAVQAAINKGIIINSIYCMKSDTDPRILTKWHSIADGSGGTLFKYQVTRRSPNKNYTTGAQRLIDLNNSLNETYIPFSKKTAEVIDKMIAADVNSLQMSERFFISRCWYKCNQKYQAYLNENDLVAVYAKHKALPAFNRDYFPKDLKKIKEDELKAIAAVRMERRQRLLEKLNQILIEADYSKLSENPIDSIFAESLSRHF
jgi:hypothetical protein